MSNTPAAKLSTFGRLPAAFALVLIICLPPLVVSLDGSGPGNWHESITLASSQETWMRQHAGERHAWLLPTVNDAPRTAKPPMIVWINLLAWSGLDPAAATSEQLIHRARLAATMLGALTLLAVFWMGVSIRDVGLGLIAALIAGTLIFFQRYARTSTYDIALLAFTALAMASVLRAMVGSHRATTPKPGYGWWALGGVFLGAAWLSKGPLALVIVLLGIVPIAIVLRAPLVKWISGTLVCFAVAAALALPWYWYLSQHVSSLTEHLLTEYSGPSWDHRPVWYYARSIDLALPWLLWFIAGLFHPFLRTTGAARRRYLMMWLWFIALFAFFSIAPPKVPRYILPLIPAFALVTAQVWRDHDALAAKGERDPGEGILLWPHWLAVLVVSLAAGPYLAMQETFVERGWLDSPDVVPVSGLAVTVIGITLVGLAVAGVWMHHRARPMHALVIGAIWASLAMTVYWRQSALMPREVDHVAVDARAVNEIVGPAELRWVRRSPDDATLRTDFLFHARRLARPIRLDDARERAMSDDDPLYLLAAPDEKLDDALGAAGYAHLMDLRTAPSVHCRLWGRE